MAEDGLTCFVFAAVGDFTVPLLAAVADGFFTAVFRAVVFGFAAAFFLAAGFLAAVFEVVFFDAAVFAAAFFGFEVDVFRDDFFPPVPFFADVVDLGFVFFFLAAVFEPVATAEVFVFFEAALLPVFFDVTDFFAVGFFFVADFFAVGFFFVLLLLAAGFLFFLPNIG